MRERERESAILRAVHSMLRWLLIVSLRHSVPIFSTSFAPTLASILLALFSHPPHLELITSISPSSCAVPQQGHIGAALQQAGEAVDFVKTAAVAQADAVKGIMSAQGRGLASLESAVQEIETGRLDILAQIQRIESHCAAMEARWNVAADGGPCPSASDEVEVSSASDSTVHALQRKGAVEIEGGEEEEEGAGVAASSSSALPQPATASLSDVAESKEEAHRMHAALETALVRKDEEIDHLKAALQTVLALVRSAQESKLKRNHQQDAKGHRSDVLQVERSSIDEL